MVPQAHRACQGTEELMEDQDSRVTKEIWEHPEVKVRKRVSSLTMLTRCEPSQTEQTKHYSVCSKQKYRQSLQSRECKICKGGNQHMNKYLLWFLRTGHRVNQLIMVFCSLFLHFWTFLFQDPNISDKFHIFSHFHPSFSGRDLH